MAVKNKRESSISGTTVVIVIGLVLVAIATIAYFRVIREKRGEKPVLADPNINRMYAPPGAPVGSAPPTPQ